MKWFMLLLGLMQMGIITFDITFNRPVENVWNKETTYWFIKNVIYAISSIVLMSAGSVN